MAVTPPNIPPNTANVSVTGPEDTPVNVPLTGTDVDGTVSEFRVVITLPAHGVLKDGNGNILHIGDVVPATGNAANLVFIPDANWNGVDTFQYAARDNGGLQDATPATATITITPVNDPPETANTSGTGLEDTPISLVLSGSDVDGTVASFTITSLPANGVLKFGSTVLNVGDTVPATGNSATVTFVPNANWNGSTSFLYASKDNLGLVDATPATATINVTPVAEPPETNNTSATGPEDAPVNLVLTGSDPDGSVASFTITSLPANGVLKFGGTVLNIGDSVPATGGSATVTFVPNANWNGSTDFKYASKDDEGLTDATPATATITITPVNDPPETNNTSGTGAEDTPVNVVLSGSDVDGTVTHFTITTLPENGVLKDSNGNVLNVGDTVPATGGSATVVFVPGSNWNGTTDFKYASKDNDGLTDPTPATATITVTPVADPPETVDTASTGAEDTPVAISLMGSDPDGTVVSFTITSLPANGVLKDAGGNVLSIGSSVPASGGAATVYFHPNANWSGETEFDYASKDNDNLSDPTPATATITVTPVNDPPETENTSATGAEDSSSIAVNLSGSDIDGSVEFFIIKSLPANGVLKDGDGNVLSVGSSVPATAGGATVFFTPNTNWNGDTTFNYASKDDESLEDPTPAVATITVTPVNDAPETNNTSATGAEDAASIPVSLSGTDIDGTVTSFTISSLPENGVLKDGNGNVLTVGSTVPATGNAATVYFVPNANWNGDTAFNYASKDNEGLSDETPATANIKVTPVNDAPETDNTSASGAEDTPISITLSGSDPDGSVTSFVIKDLPANGVLKDGNGNVLTVGSTVPATDGEATVTFTPNSNWNGDTSFHYASKDNEGLEDATPATATVTVTPVNDAPETKDVTANGTEDGPPIAVALTGSDVDGTVKVFTINSLPTDGVLKDANGNVLKVGDTVPATGNAATVYFTPNANWNGTTEFDYASKDNEGLDDLSPATATINVASVNDAPETANSAATGIKGALNIGLTLTGTDSDGTVTSFVIKSLPANGVLKDAGGNTLSIGSTVTATNGSAEVFFTPTATFTGVVNFNYASKDNEGLQDATPATGTVTITAPPTAPDPKPPETNNTSATGLEDSAGIPVKLTGSDPDGTVTSFRIDSLPANGVLKLGSTVLKVGDLVPASGNAATVTFVPNANWNGVTNFNYASKDNDGNIDATPAKATITVTGVNDAPETCDVTIKGNDCADQFKVVLAGSDIDGKVVSFKITELPNDGVLKDSSGRTLKVGDLVTANSSQQASIYFVPGKGWDGSSTFKYASVDNGGLQDATPATVTIKTDHGNNAPTTNDVSVTGKEDGGPVAIKITGADSDGTVTAFKINSLPAGGVLKDSTGKVLKAGDVVTASGGSANLTFTPNADWNGSTTFKYSARDNDGAYDATPATGTIKITPESDAPTTKDVTASGCEDGGAISVCLSGADADGKVVSFVINDLPTNGVLKDASGKVLKAGDVVTAASNGATVYFTPNANWNGSTSFKYSAKDNDGNLDLTPATAKIVVTDVNDAPTTNNVTATGLEDGGPVKVTLSGADIDGTVVAFKITTLPANGVFKDASGNVLSAGSVVSASGGQAVVYFTPKADFSGSVTFQYSAKDNDGAYDASPANGSITITPVNDGPKAVNDTASVTSGQVLKLTSTSLLSNDTDADGDKLTITSVQGAVKGTVSLGSDGVVTFSPTSGQTGAGSFTYTISDGHGGTATATVSVDIKASASAPSTGPSGPGVHTASWWKSTGQVYWDGQADASDVKHSPTHAGYPKAELTYKVDTNANGTVDSNDYLLIGDFNKNGVTDNGEHTLLISRSDAKALLASSCGDAREAVGQELVATWLNYLAENPVGSTANTSAPAWFVQEAVDWLSQLAGTTKTLSGGVTNSGSMSNGSFVGSDISYYGGSWNTGINLDGTSGIQASGKDVLAGKDIHDVLELYNSVGKVGSTIWANDA